MNNTRASSMVRTASVTTCGTFDAIDLDLKYTRSDLPSLRWPLTFAKSSAIVMLLMCSLAVASVWVTSGTRFIYDSGTSQYPLLKCPSLWNYDVFTQAPFCKISIDVLAVDVYQQLTVGGLTAPTEAEAQAKGLCVLPGIDPDVLNGPEAYENALSATQSPMVCFSKQACSQTTNWRTLNPYSYSSLQSHEGFPRCDFGVNSVKINTLCSSILSADAYCDSSYTVSPSTIVGIRGALIGIALLWLLLVSHDLYQFIILSRHCSAILKFRKSFFVKYICQERFELYNMCLMFWNSATTAAAASIPRTLTNFSVASSPLGRGSSISSSVSVLNQAVSSSSMPHQPVLTPRKSVVSDFKNSPRGYTPRLDSPPVAVVSSISVASKKLSRFNGSVDVMFKTVWKKRIARYYKLHSRNLKSIKFRRFILRSIAIALILITVFILIFRLVFVVETGPFVTRMPEGVSLYDYLRLPVSDRLYSMAGAVWADLKRANPTRKFYLVMWADFLIYLDIIYESAILLILSFLAIGSPTNENYRDDCEMKPNDRPPSARLISDKIQDNNFMDDTTRLEEDSLSSNFSSPVHMIQPKLNNSNTLAAVPKLIGSPFGDRSSPSHGSPLHIVDENGGGPGLVSQSVMCIMMSVSSPCATLSSRKDFVFKLQALRQLVESDIDIFVVDCGHTREPIDDTEFVIKTEISDDINYIYFPENNRVLSLYWTSKYWIPFLFSSNLCGDYIYALFVDEQVVFEHVDFKLPSTEFLMNNPRIKTMYVPVKESPKIFSTDFMDRWKEKIELSSIHLACGGSTTHAGNIGVPQIWERNTFEMTCFNLVDRVDKMLSILEMKENGQRLLKNRGSSKLSIWISGNGHSQPRLCGAKQLLGFRKVDNVFSNMHEFIDPSSFLHWPSVLSKLLLLGQISNTLFDSFRIFLIPGLALKDPIGFGIVTGLVGIIASIPFLVNILVNIRYEDHRAAKALYAFFVFPVQLVLKEIPRRTVAFFKGYVRDVVFTKYETDLTIGEREEQFRDLPMVPPHPNPHWSTVWM